jgi:hypothetical protein
MICVRVLLLQSFSVRIFDIEFGAPWGIELQRSRAAFAAIAAYGVPFYPLNGLGGGSACGLLQPWYCPELISKETLELV